MIEIIWERPRIVNARLLRTVLAELGDERTKTELEALMCERSPFWASQTLSAALREALRRGWVVMIEDAYGVYYKASESEGSK